VSAENDSHNPARDRELGMDCSITRRDFLDGVAVGVGAIGATRLLSSTEAKAGVQDTPGYYPPSRTGMRGSHDGSYDYAHALRDGNYWKSAGNPVNTGESYDLIIGVDGTRVCDLLQFEDQTRGLRPGETVYLNIVRDGARLQIPVNLPPLTQATK